MFNIHKIRIYDILYNRYLTFDSNPGPVLNVIVMYMYMVCVCVCVCGVYDYNIYEY